MISIYCDGASSGKADKPGGYGWIIVQNGIVLESGLGGHHCTTNNLMECEGAIRGLAAAFTYVGLDVEFELVSDSQYVLRLASGEYNPKVNKDKIYELRNICKLIPNLRFRWVKGHSSNPYNDMCDSLAKQGKLRSKEYTPE